MGLVYITSNAYLVLQWTNVLYIGCFDAGEIDNIVEESLKMSRFKHPHVMNLIGVCLDAGPAPYVIYNAVHVQWQSFRIP